MDAVEVEAAGVFTAGFALSATTTVSLLVNVPFSMVKYKFNHSHFFRNKRSR